jgi:HK97 family phage prohead protease
MSIPEKYKHINFKPPQGARNEAEKSLAWRREFGRGGTAVGIARARDLANGVEVSPSTVRRMKAFFDRHQKNKTAPGWSPGEDGFPSNSRIAWAMWGSDAGWSWAKKVVAQMNAADEKSERGLRPYGSTHGIRPKVYVVHGAPCSGKKDYVAKHLGENDVVFDYDSIMAAVSGRPMYQPNGHLVSYCLDIRTLILKKAMQKPEVDKTWIITTKVSDDMKSQLSDVPVQYVHVDTPKDECLQRLESDEQRQPLAEELRKVIEDYFSDGSEEQRRAPLAQPGVERRYIGNFSSTERLDPELLRIEKRADPETGKPRTYIVGYAARFHSDSLLLGDFVEQIDPGAFEIVTNRQDADGKPLETRCLFNHDPNHLLGRFPTTMRMVVDDKGLRYECLLPETRSDLEELIARGDLKGSSFSFVVSEGGERWTTENGQSRRIVTKVKSILDCGPVTYPAYSDSSVSVAKRSYEQFAGKPMKPQRQVRLKSLEARADALRARIATEAFLAERRDCGRGDDGKFGSGNKCQEDEGEGNDKTAGEGKKSPSNYDRLTSSPKKSSFEGKKATDYLAASPKTKKSGDEYKAKPSDDEDFLGRKTAVGEDILGRKPRKTADEPTKVSGEGKKKPPYMEWKKGNDKKAQEFIDKARTDQLARGGKSGGKSDDGSGVQTWSKGDAYPWTAKQVGDSSKGGYVQAQHPDGTKTKKYEFPAGSDGSDAYRQAEDEIKAQKKKRGERSFSETAAELRAFLEARR